jgi:amino acid adenylation domain-containing protein
MEASNPKSRLRYIIEDSQAQAILTDNDHYSLAVELAEGSLSVINIDDLPPGLFVEQPEIQIEPDAPAYIVYTSGSTGQPKGVIQTHRNVLHCMMWYTNRLHIGSMDRLSLISPLTYAYAAVVVFSSLLNGATLLPCNIRELGVGVLAGWLESKRITIHHSVAAAFRYFARMLSGNEQFSSLRLLCLGGDAAYRSDVELYRQVFPETCMFLHQFGMAEALICSALLLDKTTPLSGGRVPAGYPGDDMRVLILDEAGREIGSGEVGQIAIQSRYLTPGYWRRPELTSAAFLPDPSGGDERLYLTGDLGRVLGDGRLEHVGRADFRVKLRGQTIEVAEVETALLALPLVKEAVVIGREDHRGETYLAAYLTLYPGPAITTLELRNCLSRKVPAYMIPSAFVVLEAMPLSANGKVDRRALPKLEGARLERGSAVVPPRDPVEKALAGLWKDVLGQDSVGVYDNFFDLGGHSLLAAQLMARIDKTLGQQLPLATFFEGATISDLARQIRGEAPRAPWRSLVPIRPGGSRPPLFLVHAVFGDVLCFAELVKALRPDQPCYGLQARGLDGSEPPSTEVEDIARAYVQEIRTVQARGPYCIGGLSSGASIAYEMARQLDASGEEIALLISFDGAATPVHQRRHLDAAYPLRFVGNVCASIPTWARVAARSRRMGARTVLRRWCRTARNTTAVLVGRSEWTRYSGPEMLMEEITDILGPERAAEWPAYRRRVAEALHRAVAAYQPPPFSGQLLLFRARCQPVFSPLDPALGWTRLARGGVTVKVVPGNHDTFLYPPNVAQVAHYLTERLRQVPGIHR